MTIALWLTPEAIETLISCIVINEDDFRRVHYRCYRFIGRQILRSEGRPTREGATIRR